MNIRLSSEFPFVERPDHNIALLKLVCDSEGRNDLVNLITELEKDIAEEEAGKKRIFCGFKNAPAAVRNHHTFKGGLVVHLLEMIYFHQKLGGTLLEASSHQEEGVEYFNDSRVIQAIILHDLHKTYREYEYVDRNEPQWKVEYNKELNSEMLTPMAKTLWLVTKFGKDVEMDEIQMNALIQDHGGWSELKPKSTSVLAKYVYLLDEMSGNVLSRLRDRKYINPGVVQRI